MNYVGLLTFMVIDIFRGMSSTKKQPRAKEAQSCRASDPGKGRLRRQT